TARQLGRECKCNFQIRWRFWRCRSPVASRRRCRHRCATSETQWRRMMALSEEYLVGTQIAIQRDTRQCLIRTLPNQKNPLVRSHTRDPIGEGAGRNTPGRVRSLKGTELFRLSRCNASQYCASIQVCESREPSCS